MTDELDIADWRARGLIGPPVLDEEYAAYRDGDQPVLREATVLFLDALGTRALAEGPDAEAHLRRTHDAIRSARQLGTLTEDIHQVARWFSDNLVLGVRTQPEVPFDTTFGYLVISAAWVQLALLLQGVVVRGGIEIGGFHASEQFVYGPALGAAYELESRVAIYPRVVLGPEAVKQVKREVARGETETYRAMLAVDSDGTVFVNYLGDVFAGEGDEALSALAEHRALILHRMREHENSPKLAQKYAWMAAFHDWFVWTGVRSDLASRLLIDPARSHGFSEFEG